MDIRFEFCLCGLASAGRMESRASLQGSLQAMLTASRFLKNSRISHEYRVTGGGSDACWEEKSSEIYTDTTYTLHMGRSQPDQHSGRGEMGMNARKTAPGLPHHPDLISSLGDLFTTLCGVSRAHEHGQCRGGQIYWLVEER